MKGRGPMFASFYLVPGGQYYKWYLTVWIALAVLIGLSILDVRVLLVAAFVAFAALLVLSLCLAERVKDVAIVLTHFPPLVLYFGMAVLAWQWQRIHRAFRRG